MPLCPAAPRERWVLSTIWAICRFALSDFEPGIHHKGLSALTPTEFVARSLCCMLSLEESWLASKTWEVWGLSSVTNSMACVQLHEWGGSPHWERSACGSHFSLYARGLLVNHNAIISSFASESFALPHGANSNVALCSPKEFSPGGGSHLTQQCHLRRSVQSLISD